MCRNKAPFCSSAGAVLENVCQNSFTYWIEVAKSLNCPFSFFFFFIFFLSPLFFLLPSFPVVGPFLLESSVSVRPGAAAAPHLLLHRPLPPPSTRSASDAPRARRPPRAPKLRPPTHLQRSSTHPRRRRRGHAPHALATTSTLPRSIAAPPCALARPPAAPPVRAPFVPAAVRAASVKLRPGPRVRWTTAHRGQDWERMRRSRSEPDGATLSWLRLAQSAPVTGFLGTWSRSRLWSTPFGRAPTGAGFGATRGALPDRA